MAVLLPLIGNILIGAVAGVTLGSLVTLFADVSAKRSVYGKPISDIDLFQYIGESEHWEDMYIDTTIDPTNNVVLIGNKTTGNFYIATIYTPIKSKLIQTLLHKIVGKYYINIGGSTKLRTRRIPFNSVFTDLIDRQVEQEKAFMKDVTSY